MSDQARELLRDACKYCGADSPPGHMLLGPFVEEAGPWLVAIRAIDAALALRSESEAAWVAGELAGRQSLAHSEQAAHKAAIGQKERAEKAEALADKYKWQVRDTCVRTEKAEARTLAAEQDLAGAREALEKIAKSAAQAFDWPPARAGASLDGIKKVADAAILNLTKDATDD